MASPKSLGLFLVVTAVVVASFLSCARLLRALMRLEARARRRLFPRQLRSLALVGLLGSCTGAPVVWVQLWHTGAAAEVLCESVTNVFRVCRLISALQETHLALTFLAECTRARRFLRLLNWGILALWSFGALLGVADAVWFPYRYNSYGMMMCSVQRDFISICVVGLCLLTSCVASVATLAKASSTTLAVQRRSFRRAVWYPCISVLSYAPIMIVYAFPELFHSPFLALALLFEMANGAMNAGMYGFQSHYASRLSKSTPSADAHTNALGDVAASAGSTCPGDIHADDAESVASFDVHFGGVDVITLDLSASSFAKFVEDLPDWVDNRRLAPRLSSSF